MYIRIILVHKIYVTAAIPLSDSRSFPQAYVKAGKRQRELEKVIHELEEQTETSAPAFRKGREVIEVQRIDDRLYQLEQVRCGKAKCKCAGANEKLHGPYWYTYWREDGKLKSRYVGKNLASALSR